MYFGDTLSVLRAAAERERLKVYSTTTPNTGIPISRLPLSGLHTTPQLSRPSSRFSPRNACFCYWGLTQCQGY